MLLKILVVISIILTERLHCSLSRRTSSVSYCLSSRTCERACPEPATSSKNGKNRATPSNPALQQMNTPQCILGRCFCPDTRVATSKCSMPNKVDTAACNFQEFNAVPGVPSLKPLFERDKRLTLCRVKRRRNRCSKTRPSNRLYCVFAAKANSTGTGWILIPGLPTGMPSVPSLPGNTGMKNATGKSKAGSGKGKHNQY